MTIRLLGSDWLASRGCPDGERELELAAGTTAAEACRLAGWPIDEIGLMAVNGAKADPQDVLQHGDELKALPWIIGG